MNDSDLPPTTEWAWDARPVHPRAEATLRRAARRARQRRLLACAVMLLALTCFAGWAAAQARDASSVTSVSAADAGVRQRLQRAALDLAAQANLAVERQSALLDSLAERFASATGVAAADDCASQVRELVAAESHVVDAGIVDRDGHVLCSALAGSDGLYLGDRGYIRAALSEGREAGGDIVLGLGSPRATLHASVPIRDAAGAVVGAAYAALDLARALEDADAQEPPALLDARDVRAAGRAPPQAGVRPVQDTRAAGGFREGASAGGPPLWSGFSLDAATGRGPFPAPAGSSPDARRQLETTLRRLLVVFGVVAAIALLSYVWASGCLARRATR